MRPQHELLRNNSCCDHSGCAWAASSAHNLGIDRFRAPFGASFYGPDGFMAYIEAACSLGGRHVWSIMRIYRCAPGNSLSAKTVIRGELGINSSVRGALCRMRCSCRYDHMSLLTAEQGMLL